MNLAQRIRIVSIDAETMRASVTFDGGNPRSVPFFDEGTNPLHPLWIHADSLGVSCVVRARTFAEAYDVAAEETFAKVDLDDAGKLADWQEAEREHDGEGYYLTDGGTLVYVDLNGDHVAELPPRWIPGIDEFDATDAGCWLDGARGIYMGQAVIELAQSMGWEPDEAPETDPDGEWYHESWNDAETWLDQFAPEGYWIGPSDAADFGMWECEPDDDDEPDRVRRLSECGGMLRTIAEATIRECGSYTYLDDATGETVLVLPDDDDDDDDDDDAEGCEGGASVTAPKHTPGPWEALLETLPQNERFGLTLDDARAADDIERLQRSHKYLSDTLDRQASRLVEAIDDRRKLIAVLDRISRTSTDANTRKDARAAVVLAMGVQS